jgi:hypothetical protein
MTPRDDGLLGHAKKRMTGKCRDKLAFQDMVKDGEAENRIDDGNDFTGWYVLLFLR